MIWPFVACALIFVVLVFSEYLWRTKQLRGEQSRKFVHIIVGTYIASWPFFMDWRTIQILSVLLFFVISVSYAVNFFRSIHSVNRKTGGELAFALGIGIAATITKSEWIFAVAMLHLSLADSVAALVGTYYGKKNRYKVLGETRSIIGTAAFFAVSVILVSTFIVLNESLQVSAVILIPFVAAMLENLAVYGTDNIVVPVFVIAALSSL